MSVKQGKKLGAIPNTAPRNLPKRQVKITVVKKLNRKDIFGDHLQVTSISSPECDLLQLGQEFISERFTCPPGFCPFAFASIQPAILHLALGGNFPWTKEPGTDLWCCPDGSRPVIFKLERVEE